MNQLNSSNWDLIWWDKIKHHILQLKFLLHLISFKQTYIDKHQFCKNKKIWPRYLGCQYPVELLQPRGLQQVPGQLPLRHAHRWLLLHPRPADGEADEQVLRERLQLHPHRSELRQLHQQVLGHWVWPQPVSKPWGGHTLPLWLCE